MCATARTRTVKALCGGGRREKRRSWRRHSLCFRSAQRECVHDGRVYVCGGSRALRRERER
eukprot:3053178-Pleurochrysis_carterae.AAC.1